MQNKSRDLTDVVMDWIGRPTENKWHIRLRFISSIVVGGIIGLALADYILWALSK